MSELSELYEESYDEFESYEKLYEEGNYKCKRRAKKRHRSLAALDKKNSKCNTTSINSRKTYFIINLIYEDKEHSYEIPANKYVGRPEEYKEIKQMCIDKYGIGVRIINIETK